MVRHILIAGIAGLLLAACVTSNGSAAYPLPANSIIATAVGGVVPVPARYPPPSLAPAQSPPTAVGYPVPAGPTVTGPYAAPVFGLVIDATGVVLHVEPGGGAARSGVRVGDQLVTVADNDVIVERGAVKQAISTQPAGTALPVTIARGGQLIDLMVFVDHMVGNHGGPTATPAFAPATPAFAPADYL